MTTGYEAHTAEHGAVWRRWPTLWSPSYFVPVMTVSGRTIWQQQPPKLMRLLPPELEALLHTEGELAKAVRRLRADKAAAEESSFRESGC
ncbi:hypothetical protein ACBJ59_56675 [Nonomuraea sp. MTCD27]|uniref:hypothetical protein n=1 Tax=Nonomuraea sp. MTCD27 TaxID=1676747 RepID=UPI0035C216C0